MRPKKPIKHHEVKSTDSQLMPQVVQVEETSNVATVPPTEKQTRACSYQLAELLKSESKASFI